MTAPEIINIKALSADSKSNGLTACPVPAEDWRVTEVMRAWGQWQWENRDINVGNLHGYPSTNPLALDWGLGRPADFEFESMMPGNVEVAHQILIDMNKPEAMVVAWCYWAKRDRDGNPETIIGAARAANGILNCNFTRNNAEQWIGAVSGAVMCSVGPTEFD